MVSLGFRCYSLEHRRAPPVAPESEAPERYTQQRQARPCLALYRARLDAIRARLPAYGVRAPAREHPVVNSVGLRPHLGLVARGPVGRRHIHAALHLRLIRLHLALLAH